MDKKKKTLASSQINLTFLETTLSRIFSFRNTQDLSSRVRFKVQDLIDEYQKEWKGVIYGERNIVDEEGFQYMYVPTEAAAITRELEGGEIKKKDRKQSNVSDGKKKTYVYVKKQQPQPPAEEKASPVTPMQMLLGGLKADDEETKFRRQQRLSSDDGGNDSIYDDDDEDYKRIMNRKVSMNE